jgi:uncharacterized protein YbjT (DUF2867 family)
MEGFWHSVHHPAKWLVHRKLYWHYCGCACWGAFIGSAGEGKISSATGADFADAAVTMLTGEKHQGKIYELAADEAYTLSDLATEISRQTGKNIPYKNMAKINLKAWHRLIYAKRK